MTKEREKSEAICCLGEAESSSAAVSCFFLSEYCVGGFGLLLRSKKLYDRRLDSFCFALGYSSTRQYII